MAEEDLKLSPFLNSEINCWNDSLSYSLPSQILFRLKRCLKTEAISGLFFFWSRLMVLLRIKALLAIWSLFILLLCRLLLLFIWTSPENFRTISGSSLSSELFFSGLFDGCSPAFSDCTLPSLHELSYPSLLELSLLLSLGLLNFLLSTSSLFDCLSF